MHKTTTYLVILTVSFLASCESAEERTESTPINHFDQQKRVIYDFSSEIEKRLSSNTTDYGNDNAAIEYANVGAYFKALEIFDHSYPPVSDRQVYFDSSNFNFLPAIDYVVKEASKNQVVIINEAHHVPYHRFFTMLLLKKLRAKGFNYFGVETLSEYDGTIQHKKYPTMTSGYYSTEPQYGNLLRKAVNTGYEVFSYEPNGVVDGMQREIGQAKNIKKILDKNPDAKILIHCGYAHLYEGEVEGWGKAMAGRLTEYTGIDPLTIDQVELTEHFCKDYENPFFQKMNFKQFTVPANNGKKLPTSFRLDGHNSDIFVFHPRTKLKFNRPHWLFDYYVPRFISNEVNIPFPVLVKAFVSTEDENVAVPVDVIEINERSDSTALALIPKTSYKVIIESKDKQKQTLEFVLE